jgi:hypothetical protein
MRWLWQRRRPLALHTLDQLIDLARAADDPIKRGEYLDLIRDQSAVLHDAAGDAAQRALLGIEERMTNRFSGLVQTNLGATNDMLSDLKSGIGGLQQQLGDMFSSLGERLDDHDQRLEAAERKLAEHDQSRDRSTEERRAIQEVVDRLEGRMTAFIASSDEEALRYRTLLDELLRERERGGDGI